MFDFVDTLADEFSDFAAHDLWDLATLSPEHVSDFLLPLSTAINAHIKIEMLVNKKTDVVSFLRGQVIVTFGALIHHNVC
jgi:hypothetical protein